MNRTTIENMESMDCMSYAEQRAYYRELQEVENAIKSVNADKKQALNTQSNLDPRTNYKLTYR